MAIKTLQVTQTGSAVQVSTTPIKVKWVVFQNNAAAVMRAGDSSVTASRGYSLAASGGVFSVPVNHVATYGSDLTQWYTIGTSTQVLDVIYDDLNF